MSEENQPLSDTSGSSSENIEIPPISKQTAGAAAGAVLGSVAGPVGAVVGGVIGALAGRAATSASSAPPPAEQPVKAVAPEARAVSKGGSARRSKISGAICAA